MLKACTVSKYLRQEENQQKVVDTVTENLKCVKLTPLESARFVYDNKWKL